MSSSCRRALALSESVPLRDPAQADRCYAQKTREVLLGNSRRKRGLGFDEVSIKLLGSQQQQVALSSDFRPSQ